MNKVTVDRALIEQALDSVKDFMEYREMRSPSYLRDALRAALAEPEVERPSDYSYALIDRFLRNNLDDEDYENFSKALEDVYASPPPPAEPAPVPLLSDEEILQLTPLWFKKYTDGVLLGYARAVEQLVRRKAGL